MRQCGEAIWRATYAHDPDVTPKKAFTEGHYIAFAAGMLAHAKTSQFYEKKLEQQRRFYEADLQSLRQDLRLANLECSGLWIALVIAAALVVLSR
jgi:hypothetical protein